MSVLSVDIGSTWTKAGLFLEPQETGVPDQITLVEQWRTPTSRNNLLDGLKTIINLAQPYGFVLEGSSHKLVVSSSAKGGLSIVALGIVPELTLKAAKMAALSAGGKVISHFAYELTAEDVEKINQQKPDIILFAGGTDGGNTRIIDHNSQALQQLTYQPAILYAGNRNAWSLVESRLSQFPLFRAENLLPELSRTEPQSARSAIQSIFLEKILFGKGLDAVQEMTVYPIVPTPHSVFEFVQGVHEGEKGRSSLEQNFCLVDLGGATTDVYSAVQKGEVQQGVLVKGIPDEQVTRTVEGDLGMRISAPGVLDILLGILASHHERNPFFQRILFPLNMNTESNEQQRIGNHIIDLPNKTDWIAQEPWAQEVDIMLAKIAILSSLVRHAGRTRQVYTPQGPVWVQEGKDVRTCKRLILTGGIATVLSELSSEVQNQFLTDIDYGPFIQTYGKELRDQESLVLLPPSWTCISDHDYAIPLLANLHRIYPTAARKMFITRFLEESSWN